MRRKIPSLQALLVFEAAARHASFSDAAQALALTQSAVSRQITALEDLLGVRLFRRDRHGVTLTAAGQAYAQQVTQRLQGLEQDTQELMAQQGQGDTLQLASVPTFAARWLIPRLQDFHTRHPDTLVHIDTRTRPFLFSDTTFDAAIYAGTQAQVQQWAGTRWLHLMAEEVVAVCSPALMAGRKSLRPRALTQMPLLQQSTRPDSWQEWFATQGVDAPRAMAGPRYEQFSMAAAAAAHGMGVALVPRLLIEAELARGELVLANPLPLPSQRSYFLVQPAEPTLPNARLQDFALWLCQAANGAS